MKLQRPATKKKPTKRKRVRSHVWYIPKGPRTWMQHLRFKMSL